MAVLAILAMAAPSSRPIEQTSQGARPAVAILASFDGLGVGMKAGPGTNDPPSPRNPSDNTLAVGPTHVFQIVNSQLAIFTKKGETLYGPVGTNTLFAYLKTNESTYSTRIGSFRIPGCS